jgi:hypothetical protein
LYNSDIVVIGVYCYSFHLFETKTDVKVQKWLSWLSNFDWAFSTRNKMRFESKIVLVPLKNYVVSLTSFMLVVRR